VVDVEIVVELRFLAVSACWPVSVQPSRAFGFKAVTHGDYYEKFTLPKKPARLVVMFKEALVNIVEGTQGGLAGLLMDFEGIPLETYSRPESAFDIEVVGAEISVVVKAIQRASEMLEAGETQEVAFKSDKMVTIIRVVNDTYFLALALEPDGNFGKGRFLMRVAAPRLKTELEA
jgi:predicted regulator of Ras-like GTPase activity (Roadblock/LC7/MglB family)